MKLIVNILKCCQSLLSLVVLGILFWLIYNSLSGLSYQEIIASFEEIQPHSILWAILFTFIGYFIIANYDLVALRHLNYRLSNIRLSRFKFLSAAFTSYAISNNTGLALFVGGSIRYYFYHHYGVPKQIITQVILMSNFNFWLGFISLGAMAFILKPVVIPNIIQASILDIRLLGFILLTILIIYFYCSYKQYSLKFQGNKLVVPSWQTSRNLILIALLDKAIASLVLFILLPQPIYIKYDEFFCIYFLAIHAGVMSNIPGGIGIFEAIVIYSVSQYAKSSEIFASLIAFRAIYYFLPMLAAFTWIFAYEMSMKKFLN